MEKENGVMCPTFVTFYHALQCPKTSFRCLSLNYIRYVHGKRPLYFSTVTGPKEPENMSVSY